MSLSAQEREVVRHSIGLPNRHKRSYRNYFAANEGHADWPTLTALKARHLAWARRGGSHTYFHMTREAAEAALEPGERLDLEDFPHD